MDRSIYIQQIKQGWSEGKKFLHKTTEYVDFNVLILFLLLFARLAWSLLFRGD